MAVILPFPVQRAHAATRARRVFHAQAEFERAQKQASLFLAMAMISVAVIMSVLEVAARLR